MPGHNTWVFLMYDICLHLGHPGPPIWFVIQVVQTFLSTVRCPLSNLCYHCCDNYTFDHLSKSLLLRCAHVGWSTSSFPVVHFPSITWHPPGNLLRHKGYLIVALKFDKLFTVLWTWEDTEAFYWKYNPAQGCFLRGQLIRLNPI